MQWPVVVLCLTFASTVLADEGDEDKAELLFSEGRELLVQGRVAEACARLEESVRLSPAGGALLNLAECLERAGRVTRAWALFREAATRAAEKGRRDAEEIAIERAARLEARLPRIAIVVETPYEPIIVRRDGERVAKEAWGTMVPVDPGLHEVVAEIPNRVPFRWTGTVGEGLHVDVRVPALLPIVTRKPEEKSSPLRFLGLGIGAAGLAAAGVGVGLLVHSISLHDQSLRACPDPSACMDPTPLLWGREARTLADVSGIVIGAGAALLVGGLALFVFAPRGGDAKVSLLSPKGLVSLEGTF